MAWGSSIQDLRRVCLGPDGMDTEVVFEKAHVVAAGKGTSRVASEHVTGYLLGRHGKKKL